MREETIICRCEDLTREKLMEYIGMGFRTVEEIKRISRAGMGSCQGKTCILLIAREIADYYQIPVEDVMIPTFRPPVNPIDIAVLERAYYEKKGRKKDEKEF